MIELLGSIARRLHEAGIGVFDTEGVDGNIFIGYMPTNPDKAIAIYPTEGLGDDLWNGTQRPAVQIMTRGNGDVRTALKLADSVYNELQGLHNEELFGIYVVSCLANTYSPVELGQDSQGRFECAYTFRLEIMKEVN